MMNTTRFAAIALSAAALVACGKKAPEPAAAPAPAPAPATATAAASAPVELTDEQRAQADKQAKLDYATMEDRNLNDPHGQWAQSATASSTFGDDGGKTPSEVNAAANVAGAPDGKAWSNNHQDLGLDTLTAEFAKPVAATAVRIVTTGEEAVEAASKVEVQAVDGSWSTVWSGVSEARQDRRGSRTWFERTFPKTATPVKAVRVTFANAVKSGYKVVDAIQLVGE